MRPFLTIFPYPINREGFWEKLPPDRLKSRRRSDLSGKIMKRVSVVRWYYRSVIDELNDTKKYMDSLVRELYETNPIALLPAAREGATKLLPAQCADFRVDVTDHDDEVIVTADHIAGVSKKDITLSLVNPRTLEISYERKKEKKEEGEGLYLRERSFGSLTRLTPIPRAVTEDVSTESFRNGVLEVHLRKSGKEAKGRIAID